MLLNFNMTTFDKILSLTGSTPWTGGEKNVSNRHTMHCVTRVSIVLWSKICLMFVIEFVMNCQCDTGLKVIGI